MAASRLPSQNPLRKNATQTETARGKPLNVSRQRELFWEGGLMRRQFGETWASFAVRRFPDQLRADEKQEILQYGQEVFYVGTMAAKLKALAKVSVIHVGLKSYRYTQPGDHILYRYELCRFLRKGTFGEVSFDGIK